MYLAMIVAVAVALIVLGDYSPKKAVLLGLGFSPVFLVSLVDDLRSLPWWVRLLAQAVGASVFSLVVDPLLRLNLPFMGTVTVGFWSYPLTVLWLLLTTNAMNLIDGLDGLAAGIGAIAGLVLLASAARNGFSMPMIVAAAVVGICLGFLPFNFPPARIFMGDAGAMVLGFALGAVSLTGAGKNVAFVSLLIPILALLVPISDVVGAVVRRSARGVSIFEADQEHVHHFLLSLGLGPRRTVLLLYAISAMFGMAGLSLSSGSRVVGLLAFLLAAVAVTLFYRRRAT